MIIDATDLEPRPADDYLAEFPPRRPHPFGHEQRVLSLLRGGRRQSAAIHCDQFGCRFDSFPHAQ